jgi:hypothetical protein
MEKITAEPVSGKKGIELSDIQRTSFSNGGNEDKSRLRGRIKKEGGRSRVVNLVAREYWNEDEAKRYLNTWKVFKEAGLPVVKTVRKTKRGGFW